MMCRQRLFLLILHEYDYVVELVQVVVIVVMRFTLMKSKLPFFLEQQFLSSYRSQKRSNHYTQYGNDVSPANSFSR